MKVVVRPLKGAELHSGVARLRTLVYPRSPLSRDVEWHSSIWRWLESHPLANNEMHRWVLVTAEDREVVGHLAAVPQYYRIGGQRIVAHTPADYQVLPGYGFYALALMREFFRTCKNCVACDQAPEAIGVETWLGAEEAGKLLNATKLLDVSKLAKFPAVIPALVPRLLNRGLKALDKVLMSGFEDDCKVEKMSRGFDESFDELFENIAAVVPCLPEKDAAFLRWRYGPGSPQAPVTVLGVKGEEGLVGYAVLRVTSTNPKEGHLLDLTTLHDRQDVARALLREVVGRFKRVGVYIIRYRSIESPTSPSSEDLQRLGFFLHQKRRFTMLVKFADRQLHEAANDAANWSYSIGDGEGTFWLR